MTYRSRYLANLQLAAVLDLLLTDETNPRSLAYQFVQVAEHVEQLPRGGIQPGYSTEQQLAMSLLHSIRMVDVPLNVIHHFLGSSQIARRQNDKNPVLGRLEDMHLAVGGDVVHTSVGA